MTGAVARRGKLNTLCGWPKPGRPMPTETSGLEDSSRGLSEGGVDPIVLA
jgi:hypothetical protein